MVRVAISCDAKADLTAFNSAVDRQGYVVMGDTNEGDSTPRFYFYDAASTAIADGENVLSATGMGGTGRYVKTGQIQAPVILKKQEKFSGNTNSSGNYTVTFGAAYSVAPNIQANIIGGTNTQTIKITSISTTGFTVNVTNRNEVLGLLPTYSNVNAASVDVLVTEK